MILHFWLPLIAISAIGVGLEALDNWWARRQDQKAAKAKRAHWHAPSQYIMTHQDWRE